MSTYIHVIFYIYYHTLCLCVRVCMCACLCVCICLICIWISYPIFVQNVPYTLKLNLCDRMSYFYNQSVANHSILNMYVYCSVLTSVVCWKMLGESKGRTWVLYREKHFCLPLFMQWKFYYLNKQSRVL